MRHARLHLWTVFAIAVTLFPFMSGVPRPVLAQGQRIEPQEIALRPSDLPPQFTVSKEDTRPMDPGPGVLYSINLERPINQETIESGPIGVIQVIGRFDQSLSYEGFLDALRQQAIDENGFELVPGAPNDGGTASLQKIEGDVAAFRVGFIKRDMVIFTGWVGRRGVVSLQGLLTLAGVSSQRYDEALKARTGVSIPSSSVAAPARDQSPGNAAPGSAPAGQRGRVTNTGGSGANLRALPQVNGELLQVLQDGEAVELIGVEEKGSDGRAWRNIKTSSGVIGWVVSEYVTTDPRTVAEAPAPPPPPPPTPVPTPNPTATPVVARVPPTPKPQPTGSIDSRLTPALRVLYGIRRGPAGGVPWGDWYRAVVEESAVNIIVRALPTGNGGSYAVRTNTLTIAQAVLSEDVRTVATILAHELTHVAQSLRGADAIGACVEREVDAMQHEMIVSIILYGGPTPGRTRWEREENALVYLWANQGDPVLYKLVVDTPGYQDQCSLWVP